MMHQVISLNFRKAVNILLEKIVFEKFEETIIRNVESLLAKINKK